MAAVAGRRLWIYSGCVWREEMGRALAAAVGQQTGKLGTLAIHSSDNIGEVRDEDMATIVAGGWERVEVGWGVTLTSDQWKEIDKTIGDNVKLELGSDNMEQVTQLRLTNITCDIE